MTSKSKKILSLCVLIGVLFILGVLYFIYKKPAGKSQTITLTDAGFQPSKITVHKGDTVLFKTAKKELFWPASNLHPTHELYSEFDPKRPIDAKDTWSFTFDKVGTWPFHDHLFPYYRGQITVLN